VVGLSLTAYVQGPMMGRYWVEAPAPTVIGPRGVKSVPSVG
jgi:hypothetical protein